MKVELAEATFRPVTITLDKPEEVKALRLALRERADAYSGDNSEVCKDLLKAMMKVGAADFEQN